MHTFRSYQQAKEQYKKVQRLRLTRHIKDQLNRAALSVCLNLAEGSGKSSIKDRRRFYEIALASHREVQAIVEIAELGELTQIADQLGGKLYCLCRALTTGAAN